MSQNIVVPSMGESITEATIGILLKGTGDIVQEGEELVELETEKVNQLLYAPISGKISWKVNSGDRVGIGEEIGTIDEITTQAPKEKSAQAKQGDAQLSIPSQETQEATATISKEAPAEPKEKITQKNEKKVLMSTLRQTIAKRLVSSLKETAMLTTFNEVDLFMITKLRSQYKDQFIQQHGVKLGLMSFFVKAVVEGLKEFPQLNAYVDGDAIIYRQYFNIGIAVSTEKGLFVPVVKGCDHLSFPEIEKEIAHYAKKAREGKIAIEDLSEGGFTITNGGVFGSLLSTPILNPPQVGILGMHKIQERPVAISGKIEIRPMMYLALSYDHRVIDGKEAISFLIKIKEVLEDPSRLLFFSED